MKTDSSFPIKPKFTLNQILKRHFMPVGNQFQSKIYQKRRFGWGFKEIGLLAVDAERFISTMFWDKGDRSASSYSPDCESLEDVEYDLHYNLYSLYTEDLYLGWNSIDLADAPEWIKKKHGLRKE